MQLEHIWKIFQCVYDNIGFHSLVAYNVEAGIIAGCTFSQLALTMEQQ